MEKSNVCHLLKEALQAAENFKYWIDLQPDGTVKIPYYEGVDVKRTELYTTSSTRIAFIKSALDNGQGPVCPHLMLLRAIAINFPSGDGAQRVISEIVNVLRVAGVLRKHDTPESVESILHGIECFLPGCLVANWSKPRING